jgi:hypothetical protein
MEDLRHMRSPFFDAILSNRRLDKQRVAVLGDDLADTDE